MIIVGIDPGLARLGLGALNITGDDISLFTYGMISHPQDPAVPWNEHLNAGIYQIATDMPRFFDATKPNLVVAELVPPGKLGMNTELVIAAITTVKIIAYQFGIPWQGMAANTIKKRTTGD